MTSNAITEKRISNQLSSELCRNCATPIHSHHVAMNSDGIAVAMGRVGNKWVNCSRQVKEAVNQQPVQKPVDDVKQQRAELLNQYLSTWTRPDRSELNS